MQPRRTLAAVLAASLALVAIAAVPAFAAPIPCGPAVAGGPFLVDANCVDTPYATPVIDQETDVSSPVPLHVVRGHFEGTAVTFTFSFPATASWDGRFFQFTYPLAGQEPLDSVRFGAEYGGYTVQTSASAGYRQIAAAAKFSRLVAAEHYGVEAEAIKGYLYGWSGGSYSTIGAAENTTDVWQGIVPIVMGTPASIPNNFAVRNLAAFVLADKEEEIVAALRPGGSGDPYESLDSVERAALEEATRFGVPLQAWEGFDYLANTSSLIGLGGTVRAADPGYVVDFWNDSRYLGAEQSPLGQLFRDALAQNDTPDNRWNLALLAYARHQVPTLSGFTTYDQYRNADGTPIHPQRTFQYAPTVSRSVSGGARFSGAITAKVIVVEGLYDVDALPWHGDWYAARVEGALGETAADDAFRLWFVDNADHNPYDRTGADAGRLVGYLPVVFQALADVAAWAEDDIEPPAASGYDFADGQISLADDADDRGGPQAVVKLDVQGAAGNHPVKPGTQVKFTAEIEVPEGAGEVVRVEWDFDGDGAFEPGTFESRRGIVIASSATTYPTAGTYYAAVRVGTQRDGDATDTLTTIVNVDRVRVDIE